MIPTLITQLIDNTAGFTTIEHVRKLQPADATPANIPALFVVRENGYSESNKSFPKLKQQNFRVISLYLVCSYELQEALEAQIYQAALGWQLSPTWSSLQHIKDEPVSINGTIIWHQYQFLTWQTIKQA